MRVLIYGAGVQGNFLAHVLIRSNNDVTVLARGKNSEQLKRDGIVLRHYLQHRTTVDKVKVINELREEDIYDMIFVTMKYSDFADVLPVLAKNGSKNIILVGNNATTSDMETYLEANSTNEKNIAFGFQISGGKREKNHIVVIRFNAGGMVVGSLGKEVIFKDFFEEIFRNTNYKITYEKNMDDWLKSHMIAVLPMNLAAAIKDNNFKSVAKDNKLLRQLVAAMYEGYDVLRDLGYEVIPARLADLVKRHKHLSFLFYKLYHYLPLANQVQGAFAEVKGLYDAFNMLKERSNVKTPNLEMLVQETELKYVFF